MTRFRRQNLIHRTVLRLPTRGALLSWRGSAALTVACSYGRRAETAGRIQVTSLTSVIQLIAVRVCWPGRTVTHLHARAATSKFSENVSRAGGLL